MRNGAVLAVPVLVDALKDKELQVSVATKMLSEISSYVNLSSHTSVVLPLLLLNCVNNLLN